MFVYFQIESKIPANHPLRFVKAQADSVLVGLSTELSKVFSSIGRPSVPPERLLKASLLIALYSVRSDRMFCEMLDYNLLFRWFLDMRMDEKTLDPSSFTRLRDRLVNTDLGRRFFDSIVDRAREQDVLSSEHFTVDGTLFEAWASQKSFQPKKPAEGSTSNDDQETTPPGPTAAGEPASVQGSASTVQSAASAVAHSGQGNEDSEKLPGQLQKDEMIDFKGQKRCNDTHQSTTDEDARLMRKGPGKEAKLCYGGHALMENRNGLLVDIQVAFATTTETQMAKALVERAVEQGFDPHTLGADKGYHTKDFVQYLRSQDIAPHVAMIAKRKTPGLDGRTTRHSGYKISQRIRKRVEEIFGWMKSFGGLRKTRFVGLRKNQFNAYIVGAAFNLVRLSNLAAAA